MTPQAALIELLERVGAQQGEEVLISSYELEQWPIDVVMAMKTQKLIQKATPAFSAVCPGCEEACVMHIHAELAPDIFMICDKRSDINRVNVPTSYLEQWKVSGVYIANFISELLDLHRPSSDQVTDGRWEIGMLKGTKYSGHLVLFANATLTLKVAGHSIALTDVVMFEKNNFAVDKQMLIRLVDRPVDNAGDIESAVQRRQRIHQRVQEEKFKGNRAFLKTVAFEEAISVSRLKQLLQDNKILIKDPFR